MRHSRGPPWDRKRTRQISQFFPRSKHPRKSYVTPSPSHSQEELPWKCVPRDAAAAAAIARRAKCKSKKSARQPRAFTLVFNGCDWTVSFRGGLKWRSRRNGKTHQNEIQDSDRPYRRGESLEKIRIYFISLSACIQTLFFPSPRFFSSPRACSPLTISATGHPFAIPFPLPSSVTWKSHAPLLRDVKVEFIKIYVITYIF